MLRHQSLAKPPADSHLQTGRESDACPVCQSFILKLCCCYITCLCYGSQGVYQYVALEAKLSSEPPLSTHTLEVAQTVKNLSAMKETWT